MNIAISALNDKSKKISRKELVLSLKDRGYTVFYLGVENSIKDEIHSDYLKYNIPFITTKISRSKINPMGEIGSILRTKKLLLENKIDVLLIYGIRTFPAMVIAARLAGVKKILCVVNGSGRLFQMNGLKGCIIKLISYPMLGISFFKADHILFQNPDDLNMIKKKRLLFKNNYSQINGSGVNLDEFQYCELEEKPVFTMISRLTGSKGVNEYLEAANRVKKIYPHSIFYLIGPMDDEDSTINQKLLNQSLESGNVIMIGQVEDVRPYIRKSRVFVLPSYYPEGVPRSILEAMAMGRPIITTDSPGCRETVQFSRNGFLLESRDSKALEESIIWMIKNHEQVKDMARQSRIIATEKFDVQKVNKVLIDKIDHI